MLGAKDSEDGDQPVRMSKANHPARAYLWPKWLDTSNEDALMPVFPSPDDILITVSGGWGSVVSFCAVCPGWGYMGGFAQSKPITRP